MQSFPSGLPAPPLADWLKAAHPHGRRHGHVRALRYLAFWLRHPLWLLRNVRHAGLRASLRRVARLFSHHSAGTAPWGVNVIGFTRGEFGLGEQARSLVRQLVAAAIPVRVVSVVLPGQDRFGNPETAALENEEAGYAINLVVITAERWGFDAWQLAERVRLSDYTIGYFAWELDRLPAVYARGARLVDEIWTLSSFCVRAFSAACPDKIVRVVPPIANTASTVPTQDIGTLPPGAEDGAGAQRLHRFLCMFDAASHLDRKNPAAVVAAFRRAFPSGREPVSLIIKTHSLPARTIHPQWRAVVEAAEADPRIRIDSRLLPRESIRSLFDSVDTVVSLHRAEGFGLVCHEALQYGKGLITTDYGGVLDFLPDNRARLWRIPYRRVRIAPGQYPHSAGLEWAEPDIAAAAAAMQQAAGIPHAEAS
ncbi:MAG: glycosyltransferase [Casimicrobiaceae bacterium]